MKKFTLKVHQSNFSEESLVLNAKDFPEIKKDDIVKIYNCDDDPANHVVVKVKSLKKEGELQKNTVSIEQTIAKSFNLHAFQSVYVHKVNPMEISLDMVEVMFKEQYVSRSDMWRLKRHLVGSCTCVNEKVDFCDIRAQVNELWINGGEVKCGLVTDNTRIVLRSATALVYIFVQMSSEMWDFDAYGQLQFEKAANGFLRDLFSKWKEKCYHEFTLVLFSRSFFPRAEIELFPKEVRDVVQVDYRGLHYIDFYYCVAHHERSDDCSFLLFLLKRLFNEYKSLIQIPNCPPGYNSTSSEGNFLEAINMSLNVFEKHYVDRNFDRTGQLVLCITPGVGVFDVDRDLTVLTKERMIDNGIGSDLVCLGQKPYHAVPLFKFHQKNSCQAANMKKPPHSFNIPHWINHSFYSLNPFLDKGTVGIKHVPRIDFSLKKQGSKKRSIQASIKSDKSQPTDLPSLLTHNNEEFDNMIFGLPHASYQRQNQSRISHHPQDVIKLSSVAELKKASPHRARSASSTSDGWKHSNCPDDEVFPAKRSTPLHIRSHLTEGRNSDARPASSVGPATNLEKYFTIKEEDASAELLVGSAHSFHEKSYKHKRPPQRALINPFISSCTLPPLTSNRRRWVHTYPDMHRFTPVHRQHGERVSECSDQYDEDYNLDEDSYKTQRVTNESGVTWSSQSVSGSVNGSEFSSGSIGLPETFAKECVMTDQENRQKLSHSSGINWKSLRSPACLPITNDYFPSKQRLNNEYMEQSYNLIPDHDEVQYNGPDMLLSGDVDMYTGWQSQVPQHMTTREIFLELVNQRLCQGFQLIVSDLVHHRRHYDSLTLFSGGRSPGSARKDSSFTSAGSPNLLYPQSASMSLSDTAEAYTLNHGRQYHVVSLIGENEISVKIYKPRHPFLTSTIDYKYLLWAVGRDRYRMAKVKFAHEQYESYLWNYQDNCVCGGGADSDFKIIDSIKYWRAKFFVIPSPQNKLRLQKLETETSRKEGRAPRYDIFDSAIPLEENLWSTLDGIIKFLDSINKVRHPPGATFLQRQFKLSKDAGGGVSVDSSTRSSRTPPVQTHLSSNPLPSDTASIISDTNEPVTSFTGKKDESESQDDKDIDFERMKQVVDSDACFPGELELKIVTAMRDESYEFVFLQHQGRLHANSFLSIDAVHWCLMNNFGVNEVPEAVSLFKRMCELKYICHASGNSQQPFLYGYYIYYLTKGSDEKSQMMGKCNPQNFKSQWVELEVKLSDDGPHTLVYDEPAQQKPKSVLSRLLEKGSSTYSQMKTALIPLNNKPKTERSEWCQIQYPSNIIQWRGSIALSFNVQWMVATATCLFEMLYSWVREANRCNLSMLPTPNNPFAFPHTEKDASPLHCPLFVPLNLVMLSSQLPEFQELIPHTNKCRRRIIDFMEKVAIRFGFLRYYAAHDPEAERNNTVNSRQFVHYTGQAFLEIPVTRDLEVQGRTLAAKPRSHPSTWKTTDEEMRGDRSSGNYSVNIKDCGFYFALNHMLTKRWRVAVCEDCPSNELECDFIQFCSSGDMRLSQFYETLYS